MGDRVDAQVTNVDKAARRVSVSIKSLEMIEEKEAIEKFGSSDSGAFAGADILGAALREKASKGIALAARACPGDRAHVRTADRETGPPFSFCPQGALYRAPGRLGARCDQTESSDPVESCSKLKSAEPDSGFQRSHPALAAGSARASSIDLLPPGPGLRARRPGPPRPRRSPTMALQPAGWTWRPSPPRRPPTAAACGAGGAERQPERGSRRRPATAYLRTAASSEGAPGRRGLAALTRSRTSPGSRRTTESHWSIHDPG